MIYTRKIRLLVGLLIGVCSFQITGKETEVLSFQTFIQQTLLSHPQKEAILHQYQSNIESALMAEGLLDWNLFLAPYFKQGNFILGRYNPNIQTTNIFSEANHVFTQTGTRFSTSTTYTLNNNNPTSLSALIPNKYSNLSMDITVKQPLLQNAWGLQDKITLSQSEISQELYTIKVEEDIEDLIIFYSNEYLNWTDSYLTLQHLKEREKKAEDQVNLVQKQVNRGVSEKLDLDQAKQNLSQKRLDVLIEEEHYQSLSTKISGYLHGTQESVSFSDIPDINSISLPSLDLNNALDYFVSSSNTKEILLLQESLLTLSTQAKEDQLNNSLNLVVGTKAISRGDNNEDLLNTIYTGFSIGLDFALPLKHIEASHSFSASQEKLEALQKENEAIIRDTLISIMTIYNELENTQKQLTEAENFINISMDYEKEEEHKYNQGRSTSQFFILSAQDTTLAAKITLDKLHIKYFILLNQLSGLLDLYKGSEVVRSTLQ